MDRSILERQLVVMPKLEGEVVSAPVVVAGGMGGSAFPALAARFLDAKPYIISHRDYGLPPRVPEGAAYVAISYSGESEETLSFAKEAIRRNLPLSVVTSGGTLLGLAKEHGLSYVTVPQGFVPRDAAVSMTNAFLTLIGESERLFAHERMPFNIEQCEEEGQQLGMALTRAIPVFYTSTRNELLGYLGKIFTNETAKMPAFSNVFPEHNHNELQGFDHTGHTEERTHAHVTVFLRDSTDHERVGARMDLAERLLSQAGLRTLRLMLPSSNRAETFLYGWWLTRTAAQVLAKKNGADPQATPLIDTFKNLL